MGTVCLEFVAQLFPGAVVCRALPRDLPKRVARENQVAGLTTGGSRSRGGSVEALPVELGHPRGHPAP